MLTGPQPIVDKLDKLLSKDSEKKAEVVATKYSGFVQVIMDRYTQAKANRLVTENKWLAAYRNYRGQYDSTMLASMDEDKCKAFVKLTKTKVLAAYGQLLDVLFANNQFPIGVAPTVIPEGISEVVHIDPNAQPAIQDPYGYAGDGKEIPPGYTVGALELGDFNSKYSELPLSVGPSPNPQQMPEIRLAKIAAENMEKVILDQLDASNGITHLQAVVFECCLLGSGILKGPTTLDKAVPVWKRNPETGEVEYSEKITRVPEVRAVSCWHYFSDPRTRLVSEAEWHIERHPMNASDVRNLIKQPFFNADAINKTIMDGPNYQPESYEIVLRDASIQEGYTQQYEVLEYWGIMDRELAERAGLEIQEGMKHLDQVPINAWICGGNILRLVTNPFQPTYTPYFLVPYEQHPYQPWGIGVAENMDDAQMILNGITRMTIDNLALSGNVILDVDESALVSGQDLKIKSGKIFRRATGQPGQAIYGIKLPNTAIENMQVFDRFRQLADEQTGIPSYSHGQTGISGTTRTASGMSMLFGASALNIKTVIKNIDTYILKPLGEALFAWNMQFNENPDLPVRGDLEIRAKGTSALMQKEVRSQRLMTFMQVGQNPYLAPFIKWPTILTEVAKTLDLDPKEVINDPTDAAIYARIIGATRALSAGALDETGGGSATTPGQSNTGGVAAGAIPSDTQGSGGGNIGTGNAPAPGESGFSANASKSSL